MILYINNEHCSSVEQLKRYFAENITPESDTYADLQDYGRHGDIAVWLREMGEPEMAGKVGSISGDLNDHAFFAQLKAAILGTEIKADESLKPSFDKCFAFESVKCEVKDNEAKISTSLKVLMSVNEEYELCVSSNWGTRGEMVNPHNYSEGKIITIDFALRKRPGKELGLLSLFVDGIELAKESWNSKSCLFENIPCIYEAVGDFSEGLAIVKQNGKYGYIDKNAKLVIPCVYDHAYGFSENYAVVNQNGKEGYIDKTGMIVIPCIYEDAISYSGGLARVKRNGKSGYIDKSGKLIIPCIYETMFYFVNGLCPAEKDGKWGFVDKSGRLIIPHIYFSVRDFHEDVTGVKEYCGSYIKFIDRKGQKIFDSTFDDCYNFSEGYAAVKDKDLWGFIDKYGIVTIPCIYDSASSFTQGIAVVKHNGKCGIINTKGQTVLPYSYDEILSFSEGLACVKRNGKCGFVNSYGELQIPCIYDDNDGHSWNGLNNFSEGLARVCKNGKFGFIDKSGILVVPCEYEYARPFSNGYAAVKQNGKWGFLGK